MAKLTITDAARITGVSRVTLHRYIKAGKLSRSADGMIDTAELLRIGLVLQADTVLHTVTVQRDVTPPETSPVTSKDAATLQQLITVLQRELDAAHTREEAARERETLLLQMLQQMQQQNQRLLDMPRTSVPPQTAQEALGATQTQTPLERGGQRQDTPQRQPPTQTGDPRGDMRRRIVALLTAHPAGLTPAEMRELLGVERSLADTCLGMRKYGLIQRVGRGRYVAL
jgi:DNA-binding transcriptional MerR regulator